MKSLYTLVVIIGFSAALPDSSEEIVTIQMPTVTTEKMGEYVCYAYPFNDFDAKYLASSMIRVHTDSKLVHHVTVGVCGKPMSKTDLWVSTVTRGNGRTCDGPAINFVGWDDTSNSHEKFIPPEGLRIRVGRKSEYKYLLIEVHFGETVTDPRFSATNVTLTLTDQPSGQLFYQSYLLMNYGYIPANSDNGFFSNVACAWNKPSVMAYRYYLHAHSYTAYGPQIKEWICPKRENMGGTKQNRMLTGDLRIYILHITDNTKSKIYKGVIVEGYLIRNGTWRLIGSQLSRAQTKETYIIPGGPIEIRTGDVITARCLYINKSSQIIEFGKKEMCNFHIEFGYRAKHKSTFLRPAACMAPSPEFNFCDLPQTSGIC